MPRLRKGRKAAELPFKCGRSQRRCEEREVTANFLKLKLISQWIQWDNFHTVSSTKQEFGLHTQI